MILQFRNYFKNKRFAPSSIPIALLVTAVISFGLLIPKLGFYWDDWERILVLKLYGISAFPEYFSSKRPFAAWVYMLFGPLLGGNPVGWHVLSLLARTLAAASFWWLLELIWPDHRRQAFFASLLFLVYPIFLQQSVIVYFKHWLAYSFCLLSTALMILAIRKPQKRYLLVAGAILTELLHLSLLEYFAGLELLKPIAAYIVFREEHPSRWKAIYRALLHWLPYLIVLGLYAVWRFQFGAHLEENPYSPELLTGLLHHPGSTLRSLINIGIQDILYIFFSAWHKTLKPGVISLDAPFSLFSWAVAFLLAAGLTYYINHLFFNHSRPENSKRKWAPRAILVGLIASLLGAVPVWITFRAVSTEGLFNDRFALACQAGASLVWVALLEWLIENPRNRTLVLNFLVMLGVCLQIRTANDFRWSWTLQERTYWQLYWRAPYIEDNTTLLTDRPLFNYVLPQFSFNLLYQEPADKGKGGYIFTYTNDFIKDEANWIRGKDLEIKYLFFDFKSNTKNSVVLFKEDRTSNCLWVLDSNDRDNPYLPDALRKSLQLSNPDRIHASPLKGHTPPEDVFGREPERGWCYYYEKGDLAVQNQDYEEAARLGDEALSRGFTPSDSTANSPQEWIPFIESYAALGRWPDAKEITSISMQVDNNYRQDLCGVWQRIENEFAEDEAGKSTTAEIYGLLDCAPYLN